MAIGALVLFFPYTFPQELSRYEFAKRRWCEIHSLPSNLWTLKAQQETFTQCFANSAVLAVPFLVACSNPTEEFSPLEIIGVVLWGLSWLFENVADGQKQLFLNTCKQLGKSAASKEKKHELKQAVLGMAPFDGYQYSLWTISRHPNYLGEYLCWCSLCLASLPSVLVIYSDSTNPQAMWLACVCIVGLYLILRFFYDCLVNWTGSEPAEFGSLTRRPRYSDYQVTTPVLFPRFVPFIDGHMERGWPYPELLLAKHE
jgi:steroid 5-alpha reductase family enzyme